MTKPFSVRMWDAIRFIERNPREVHRQLDEAFENYDGHAMCAALYTMAEKRPRLKQLIGKFVSPPDHFAEAKALMGKSMDEIRKVAQKQREEANKTRSSNKESIAEREEVSQGLLF